MMSCTLGFPVVPLEKHTKAFLLLPSSGPNDLGISSCTFDFPSSINCSRHGMLACPGSNRAMWVLGTEEDRNDEETVSKQAG